MTLNQINPYDPGDFPDDDVVPATELPDVGRQALARFFWAAFVGNFLVTFSLLGVLLRDFNYIPLLISFFLSLALWLTGFFAYRTVKQSLLIVILLGIVSIGSILELPRWFSIPLIASWMLALLFTRPLIKATHRFKSGPRRRAHAPGR